MTEGKPINTCEFFDICETDCGGTLEDTEMCSCYELYKQLAHKTQECEELKLRLTSLSYADEICALEIDLKHKTQECDELKEYYNKCCEEFENEKKELLEKYNQLSKDFYSGKYCNEEKCKQLYQLKAEKEKLKTNNEMWKTFDVTLGDGSIKTQISDMSLAEYSQVKLERDRAEQKLEQIREIFDFIDPNYVWYNGKKAYIGDDLIEFLKTSVIQIIDEVE